MSRDLCERQNVKFCRLSQHQATKQSESSFDGIDHIFHTQIFSPIRFRQNCFSTMAMSIHIGRLLGSRSPWLLNAGYNLNRNALFTTSAQNCIKMKIVQPNDLDKLSYDEKNALLKREQSPHLTIYKFQLTSMMSISHRITGLILTGYAGALCLGAILPPNDVSYWVTAIESMQLSSPTLAFIKFYIALPATYHTFNGIRHLAWDNGKNLQLKDVYRTGYIVIALSVISALGLAMY